MKIPFALTLSGLTLKGKDREKAKAYHNLKGEELERAILSIDYDTESLRDTDEYKIKKLDIDNKYGKIDPISYQIEVNKIKEKDDTKRKLNELTIWKKWGKITELEYNKKYNDVLHKPWVAIRTNYDENANPDNLEMEVAYNDTFIENMRKKGLPGETPEEVAEQWLKLFLIANLEEDDLKMIGGEDEEEEDHPIVSKTKLNDKTTFIS